MKAKGRFTVRLTPEEIERSVIPTFQVIDPLYHIELAPNKVLSPQVNLRYKVPKVHTDRYYAAQQLWCKYPKYTQPPGAAYADPYRLVTAFETYELRIPTAEFSVAMPHKNAIMIMDIKRRLMYMAMRGIPRKDPAKWFYVPAEILVHDLDVTLNLLQLLHRVSPPSST
jgi:hypothetical protein